MHLYDIPSLLHSFLAQTLKKVTMGASLIVSSGAPVVVRVLAVGVFFVGVFFALLAPGALHFKNSSRAFLIIGMFFFAHFLLHDLLRWHLLQLFFIALLAHSLRVLPMHFHFLHFSFTQLKYSLITGSSLHPLHRFSRQLFKMGSTGTSGGFVTFGAFVTSALYSFFQQPWSFFLRFPRFLRPHR